MQQFVSANADPKKRELVEQALAELGGMEGKIAMFQVLVNGRVGVSEGDAKRLG